MAFNLLGLTSAELTQIFVERYGKGKFHAVALLREVFKKGNRRWFEAPEFSSSPKLTLQLRQDVVIPDAAVTIQHCDGLQKFATRLDDSHIIESVIIPAKGRTTLCVSSQVGCAMACAFCATGEGGLIRNLSVEEIVGQLYTARFNLKQTIDNIVFMGMGEPFENFTQVMHAIRVMSDRRGFDIPLSRITISTAGHIEGLARFASQNTPRLRLAVSINAADDAVRSSLMPINKAYPLRELKAQLQKIPLTKNGIIFIEYVLLAGVNDSPEMADRLAEYLQGLPVRVNLIRYNRTDTLPFAPPTEEALTVFKNRLLSHQLFVRVRESHGTGIEAACGQLRTSMQTSR